MPDTEELIDFFHTCGKLKDLKRQGWLRFNIDPVESVADHSWRLALISLIFYSASENRDKIDLLKMLKMALLHDLAEVETGDITPGDGISSTEKLEREREGMKKILPNMVGSDELLRVWEEYAEGKTPEAKLVYALDKFEMALQAVEYEKIYGKRLAEFYSVDPEELPNNLLRDLFIGIISVAESRS